ncbi:hypothetical protein GW17_00040900 [Ensete ventricosum]|nr:hypothetical protein GW17_00040900 [Ensete ventricosum]
MGIRLSKLFWSLVEKPRTTVPKMMQRANHFIAVETLIARKHKEQKRPRTEQPRGCTSGPSRRRIKGPDFSYSQPSMTLLNSTWTEIFPPDKGEGAPGTTKPHQDPTEERDKGRYSHFHCEYDHDTEECRDLKNQIEDLIHQGHLGHYIDVIVDGPAAGGDSTSARKAYARAAVEKRPRRRPDLEISFQPEGEEYPDHDDALVVTVRIANARVKQITIDTGSATDILYFETFQKLGLTDQDLTPPTSTLIGFTGDSIAPLGMMTLPLTIGEEPRTKTLIVVFMVVDLPLAYNAIIGRPTLNRLRAVVSSLHHSMKFPINKGVGEARSDPWESRRCYLTATTLPKKPRTTSLGTDPRGPENSF